MRIDPYTSPTLEINMPLQAVALMGATGTGKSALAMRLAAATDRCVIACDSMQVYQGLDIGTAKPSLAEQQQVRHAVVDCVTVEQTWNAQLWADMARQVIQQENERGNIPLIVGGTGMYLQALCQGFAQIPAVDEAVRFRLEQQCLDHGIQYLYKQLQAVDVQTAQRLQPNDSQRILRALSVFEGTGITLSAWHQRQQQEQMQAEKSLNCPVFVLEVPREDLRARLAARFTQMMDLGWLEECIWLQAQQLEDTHPVMRAVGYRQLLNHLQREAQKEMVGDSQDNLQGDYSLEQAVTDGITATRRYAKRQNTWFRNQTKDAVRGDTSSLEVVIQQQLSAAQSRI
ncbi:MAG: tRNA (adenosine(37)-N6)-dimethylallyltransferase MiaA [Mariprofundaceae bacterium]|nr:tRNA (adenosine(37)-N6)-dimethylallyltransferase MiaA [Mariprofundaceae bacterium]